MLYLDTTIFSMKALKTIIREGRLRKGLTQVVLAQKVGVDPQTISNVERGRTQTMQLSSLRYAAEILELPLDEVLRAGGFTGEFEQNVDPYGSVDLASFPIPVFDLAIGASPFADLGDAATMTLESNPEIRRRGMFIVKLRGDSMLPAYKTGERVLLQILPPDYTMPMETGRCYYVQLNDGRATFKRLVTIDEQQLVFEAINKRVMKKPIAVNRSDITRLAVAVYKVVEV